VYTWDCGLFGKVPLGIELESGWIVKVSRYGVGWKGISFVENHAKIS
jgi:hypothetical protein